jgi:hypothetical protein
MAAFNADLRFGDTLVGTFDPLSRIRIGLLGYPACRPAQ